MLRFKVQQLQLGGRHYLLLPKLNSRQVEMLLARLRGTGCSVQSAETIAAKSREGTLRISTAGLCWSFFDASDLVLPVIPDLLACPKEPMPLSILQGMYYRSSRTKGGAELRLLTRLESSSSWAKLRASGECGLSPDEHSVASFLLRRAEGKCTMLTDFPTDNPTPRLFGRKRYFDVEVEPLEAASTLRIVGGRATRNSYLRRDGSIGVDGLPRASRAEWLDLLAELGEWCFFQPL